MSHTTLNKAVLEVARAEHLRESIREEKEELGVIGKVIMFLMIRKTAASQFIVLIIR